VLLSSPVAAAAPNPVLRAAEISPVLAYSPERAMVLPPDPNQTFRKKEKKMATGKRDGVRIAEAEDGSVYVVRHPDGRVRITFTDTTMQLTGFFFTPEEGGNITLAPAYPEEAALRVPVVDAKPLKRR
jgi:hypothetical protein